MSLFSENLNIQLNDEQLVAIEHLNGPALVLAVPGSGKTTLLICRTLNLIEKHRVSPNRILSLTFSKAAALDMAERYQTLFPNIGYTIGFSTIHRFCYSVLLAYLKRIQKQYTLLESKDSPISKQKMLRNIYYDITHSSLTEDIYDELNTGIGYVKNMMLDPKEHKTSIDKFYEIFTRYESLKKESLLMDFDDMLTMCYKLLVAKPDILSYYQNKFDYIQVDESQDTSKVQHKIIQLIAQKHQNIYMVADDDQSIYGFRGAFPEVVVNIEKYYPKAKRYLLSTNYRSSKDIISLCHNIINKNQERHHKIFNGHNEDQSIIDMVYVDTTHEQTKYIVETHKENDLSKAVLFRNNLSLIPIVDYLDREDVDFMIKDPKHNFFTNWCTMDILAFIKVALVPNDVNSFERIYYKMNAYLSKVQIQYIKDRYDGINLFDTLITLPDLEPFKLKSLRKIKFNFEQLSKLSPEIAIDFIEDELNYRSYLVNNCKKNSISLEAQNKYIDALKVIAKRTASLTEFLMRLDDLKNIIYRASQNKNPYALKLLSMHASKGLEFDHVFIVDIDHNVFPSKYAIDLTTSDDESLFEEERRLFYVALSRAKGHLTLVHTKFKNGKYNKASEFVKDFINSAGDDLKTITYAATKEEINYMDGFEVGDKLLHTSFGIGYLIEIAGDRIMIEFKDSTKTLSSSICLDSKIIMKID